MMRSAPSSTAQPTISENMARTSFCLPSSAGSQMFEFEMLPAMKLPGLASATDRAICRAERLRGSSRSSLPMTRIFSRCPLYVKASTMSEPARWKSTWRDRRASGNSRATSGTNSPAVRYPRFSSSKRKPSAQITGPASRRWVNALVAVMGALRFGGGGSSMSGYRPELQLSNHDRRSDARHNDIFRCQDPRRGGRNAQEPRRGGRNARDPAEANGTPTDPAEATGTVAIPARRDGRSAVLLVRGRAEVDREATVAIGALAEVGRGGVLRSVAGLGLGCSLRGRLCGAGGHFLGAPVRGVLRNLVRTRKRVVLERSRMRQIVRSRVGVLPVPVAGAIDVAGTLGAVDAAEAAETTGGSRRVGTILTVGRTRGGPASPRPQGRERFEDEPRSGRSIPPQSPFERSPGQHTRPD